MAHMRKTKDSFRELYFSFHMWIPGMRSGCQFLSLSLFLSLSFSLSQFFKTEILCRFGMCPGTHSCSAGWPLTHEGLPATASQMLGL